MATGLILFIYLLSIGPASPRIADTNEECSSSAFACKTTNDCIGLADRCDGHTHCPDGSDEECTAPECLSPDVFGCDIAGSCLSLAVVCDGYDDCEDGSDEENCTGCPLPDSFKCRSGGCVSQDWQCDSMEDCNDGSDEENCTGCSPPYDFKCESGECLPYYWQCDGQGDCDDGSDERCTDECPLPNYFKCSSGGCVPQEWQCDGFADCGQDSSDEDNCRMCALSNHFQCESGECVPQYWQCDGEEDCSDGSDEKNCTDPCSLSNYFKCESGGCIHRDSRCDGDTDCVDSSDEEDCMNLCPDPDDFMCESGECVWRCDGDHECSDGSDEDNCTVCFFPSLFNCESGGCVPPYFRCNGFEECDDGSDEEDCMNIDCYDPDDFKCQRSGLCIPESDVRPDWHCDGVSDCRDGSDEESCTGENCPPPRFYCGRGSCIDDTRRCDGVSDCHDESDERVCVCTSVEFQCARGSKCVAPSAVCDGVIDCDDASDELLCQTCAVKGLWQCDSGECIHTAWVCDGDKDCSTVEDEENCHTPCSGLQLECDGRCLPKYRLCDRLDDCSNGQDEMNCTAGGCSAEQFSCTDGTCLLKSQLCDNLTDCSGGEDEEDCEDSTPPGNPLGLTSRYIPDFFVTASSEYKPEFAPFQARHSPFTTPAYCWVPSAVVDQWIQFGPSGLAESDRTRTRFGLFHYGAARGVPAPGGCSNWDLGSWVTSFTLAFSMDGASWEPYVGSSDNVQVFRGNRDRYNRVSRPLSAPVTSRYIRLYPTGYAGWVAMVMEVYVTNDENTWLQQDQYVPLGVGIDPDDPAAVPKVPDLDMSASSRAEDIYPWQARLNSGKGQQRGAYWSPAQTDTDQWLQIKHDRVYRVAGVITQGAYNLDYWVTSYKLAFSVNGQWTTYSTWDGQEMVFEGNNDSHRYARNLLDNPAFALYTRFYPLTFHNRTALRVELLVIDEIDSQFSTCGDGDVYHNSLACDGTKDCSTGEDEENCDECAMECLADLGDACIPSEWICDELVDCVDGADEKGCVEGVPKHCFFTCGNNVTCLPTSQLGDGRQDCANREDESPNDIEESLGHKWGSCSHNCTSVYGNASCVPDAFVCDGDADCLEKEDEQGCDREDFIRKAEDCRTFYCSLPGSADLYCVHGHLICDGHPDCAAGEDEQGCGGNVPGGMPSQAGKTGSTEPTTEPTSSQGAFQDHTELHAGSCGPRDQAIVWMTAALLGGHLLYRMAV
ncbi:PREDICTED: low-density lipoprotein receptor-related protein 1-like [Branchiostoma belcheri]|uniref:Low-density lipoprotein receptor-related protein 1-like n=1 Tax=Branchiostoma belcheri TaxID=7741 RepID=A0A6P4ZG17_BRABE|nr:PREDICTED: low-density lipoprotein receptor-related protein 1-like [Branchiostoma belcheri]